MRQTTEVMHEMVDTSLSPNASLPRVLAARARAASDGRLVVDVVGGLLSALGVAVWHPAAWLILFNASVFLAAFGIWGIAEREIGEHPSDTRSPLVRSLRVVQVVALVVGGIAAIVACLEVLGLALGTWIS